MYMIVQLINNDLQIQTAIDDWNTDDTSIHVTSTHPFLYSAAPAYNLIVKAPLQTIKGASSYA